MTLRTRVALAVAAAASLCLVLVACLMFVLERQDLRRGIDDELTRQAGSITQSLVTTGEIDDAVQPGPLGVLAVYAQAVDSDGTVLPLTSREAVLPVDDRTLAVARGEASRFFDDQEISGTHVRVLTVPAPGGAVQVAHQLESIDLHLVHVVGILSLLVVFGLGVALVVGGLVARAALRPLRRLADEAESLAASWVPGQQLPRAGDRDLRRLVTSLNSLLGARDEALRSQRQLVADAAHELRTPLTSVSTNLQVLLDDQRVDGPERAALTLDLMTEVTDLTATVGDLIELAREPDPGLDPEPVALDDLVDECARWCRRRHPDVALAIDLEPVVVPAFRSDVARLVINLLENAAKWSPPGAPVEVSLAPDRFVVRDHGPGIAPADLPFVFDRFFRSDQARGTPGSGLGLAIVRRVADRHGWAVAATNAGDGGAVIQVRLDSSSIPNSVSSSPQVAPVRRSVQA
jgi:two-component system sensor histidine kinase MprB